MLSLPVPGQNSIKVSGTADESVTYCEFQNTYHPHSRSHRLAARIPLSHGEKYCPCILAVVHSIGTHQCRTDENFPPSSDTRCTHVVRKIINISNKAKAP
jgi:hypothetical protein